MCYYDVIVCHGGWRHGGMRIMRIIEIQIGILQFGICVGILVLVDWKLVACIGRVVLCPRQLLLVGAFLSNVEQGLSKLVCLNSAFVFLCVSQLH